MEPIKFRVTSVSRTETECVTGYDEQGEVLKSEPREFYSVYLHCMGLIPGSPGFLEQSATGQVQLNFPDAETAGKFEPGQEYYLQLAPVV